jgi:uncharacterized LabA/DUF88 family protein
MRYAILLDGSFMLFRLRGISPTRAVPTSADVVAECERVRNHPLLAGHDMLRILFYDAPPLSGSIPALTGGNDNLGRTAMYKERRKLLDELELAPNFALRLGELAFGGYRMRNGAQSPAKSVLAGNVSIDRLEPIITQKGVDMRIGLDIARLSLRERVDTIAVTTGDSDFIPAFKFARREGVRVYLHTLGGPVKRELKAHADLVLEFSHNGGKAAPMSHTIAAHDLRK